PAQRTTRQDAARDNVRRWFTEPPGVRLLRDVRVVVALHERQRIAGLGADRSEVGPPVRSSCDRHVTPGGNQLTAEVGEPLPLEPEVEALLVEQLREDTQSICG